MKTNKNLLIGSLIIVLLIACQLSPAPLATNQDSLTKTPELTTQTSEPTLLPTATELPSELTDAFGVPMVLIPEGEFTMGKAEFDFNDSSYPAHQVYLDAFYMDIYEVTNSAYKTCVDMGSCTPPNQNDFGYYSLPVYKACVDTGSCTPPYRYYGNSEFENYPVIWVTWNQAATFCEWRGAHLPTEAQWEKAARGTDGRIYPWGDQFDGSQANFCDKNCFDGYADKNYDDGYSDTAPVGSYESGKSPYGIYNMAGNVSEWVADWYSDTYYDEMPFENPLGPNSGSYRVTRGGSWRSGVNVSSSRGSYGGLSDEIGFRCARNVNP
jgi:formylglycine-generating enzyme required for sulfatase activity